LGPEHLKVRGRSERNDADGTVNGHHCGCLREQ
jgi:hypothetical protein